jgi:DNA-binding XRE family transcriptional regulator
MILHIYLSLHNLTLLMTVLEQNQFYQMLGNCIRKARIKAGLKQHTFASFLSLSRASIVNIEKGRQRPPIHLIWVIAKVLNIEVNEILPSFTHSEEINAKWKRLISKQTKGDKLSKEKLLNFIGEIQSLKTKTNVK